MAKKPTTHPVQEEPEYSITAAEAPHSEGLDHRMKRYALQMGLRIVCLVVAVSCHGWIRWAAVVGVVVLPWVAVVLANGNDRAEVRDASYYVPVQHPQLASGPDPESTCAREQEQGRTQQRTRTASASGAGTGAGGGEGARPSPSSQNGSGSVREGSAQDGPRQDGPEVLDGEFWTGQGSHGSSRSEAEQ